MSDDDAYIGRFQIRILADDSGYVRHECPSCMLDFKLNADEDRFNDVLEWWTSRVVAEILEAP